MDASDQTRTALSGLATLVHATSASQLDNATPCQKWAVRDLLNHVVGGGYMFATCIAGGTVDPSAPGDLLGDDHAAAFDNAVAAFESALAGTDDLSTPVTLPFGTMPADIALRIAAADLLVHSWDLAKATGQPFDPSPDFVASATPFFRQFLQPPMRDGDMFADVVDAPAGATAIEQLVAFSGRQL